MIRNLIGRLLANPRVHHRLIDIAAKTPDDHIYTPDHQVYMWRFWLFNKITDGKRKYPFIPFSIRVHNICLPDNDRHMHDHPFSGITWIMRGGYTVVEREELDYSVGQAERTMNWRLGRHYDEDEGFIGVVRNRVPGHWQTIGFERYHKITHLAPSGAWTLFMFGRYRGVWGFLVDGVKVDHRDYKG